MFASSLLFGYFLRHTYKRFSLARSAGVGRWLHFCFGANVLCGVFFSTASNSFLFHSSGFQNLRTTVIFQSFSDCHKHTLPRVPTSSCQLSRLEIFLPPPHHGRVCDWFDFHPICTIPSIPVPNAGNPQAIAWRRCCLRTSPRVSLYWRPSLRSVVPLHPRFFLSTPQFLSAAFLCNVRMAHSPVLLVYLSVCADSLRRERPCSP